MTTPPPPRLNLSPADRVRATFRPFEPPPRPVPPVLPTEPIDVGGGPERVADLLARPNLHWSEELLRRIAERLDAAEYIEAIRIRPASGSGVQELLLGFRRFVLPFLSRSEVEALARPILANWNPAALAGKDPDRLPFECHLAAYFGLHDEIAALTARWSAPPPGTFVVSGRGRKKPHVFRRAQDIVFGLGSAEEITAAWRRLRLRHFSPEQVRVFLACTEFAALDCIRDSLFAERGNVGAGDRLAAFALAEGPAVAEPMLACALRVSRPVPAWDWLRRFPEHAAIGLIPIADGAGSPGWAARNRLRDMRRRGDGPLIATCLAREEDRGRAERVRQIVFDPPERAGVPFDEDSTPPRLRAEFAAVVRFGNRRLPAEVFPAKLPPLRIGDRCLNVRQVGVVLGLLKGSPLGSRPPLFEVLRELVSEPDRDEFVEALFTLWFEHECPKHLRWLMGTIAHLGGAGSILRLMPFVRTGPAGRAFVLGGVGLECLRGNGSDFALQQIAGIARRTRFRGLQKLAVRLLRESAAERGLTPEGLEDRIVPDCGFDRHGRRVFERGASRFEVLLGSDLTPRLRDSAGRELDEPPPPDPADDPLAVERTRAEWRLLVRQLPGIVGRTADHLEHAFTNARRWAAEEFHVRILSHPIVGRFARQLLWGTYDQENRLTSTFRLTDEGDAADVTDHPCRLPTAGRIGIVHPLELPEAARVAWGEVFSEYAIVPPFPQLGRSIHTLPKGMPGRPFPPLFKPFALPAPDMVHGLERLGWVRGQRSYGGSFLGHSKQFPTACLTAWIKYAGNVGTQSITMDNELLCDRFWFCRGLIEPTEIRNGCEVRSMPIGDIPPTILSEVLADLAFLASKAR